MEQHRQESQLADIILGGQDGLVNVLGLVLGIAAASGETRLILAGGLAATFAESISMAAVAFTSKSAERSHYQAELLREQDEMEKVPDQETEEVREIFRQRGFSGDLLESVTKHVTSDKDLWLRTMMDDELHLREITPREIYRDSAVVGISTLIGSFIPLLSFFFLPDQTALWISIAISALALLLVGIYKAKTTIGHPVRSGIQMVLIGLGSALAGYLVGLLFRA